MYSGLSQYDDFARDNARRGISEVLASLSNKILRAPGRLVMLSINDLRRYRRPVI